MRFSPLNVHICWFNSVLQLYSVKKDSFLYFVSLADLKRTIAVLLDDILQRLVKLENKVDYIVVNGSTTNTTNGNLMPATTSKRVNAASNIR